ncbi:dual oxidase 2-like [Branchiostoma floridae x Branchiostoma japonicum]
MSGRPPTVFAVLAIVVSTVSLGLGQSSTKGFQVQFSHYEREVEYEGYDGWYNNRAHPEWGIADSPLTRRLPSHYHDGVYRPSGSDRPNPRSLSELTMKGITGNGSYRNRSALLTFFGQQVVEEVLDAQRPGCPIEYFNIPIPRGDPDYDPDSRGGRELPFLRSRYDMGSTGYSPNNPRQQLNEITPYLDGGLMYGVTKAWADALRLFSEDRPGRLMSCGDQGHAECGDLYPAYNTLGLPFANPPPPRDHVLKPSYRFFKIGNPRGNENPFLLTFGILWFRWHNYLADRIHAQFPDWHDEKVFNEARKWVIATHQKIVLYDWLPAFLGEDPANYTGYKSSVHPGITHVFQSAAMRWGHTIVPPGVYRRSRVRSDGTCAWRSTTAFTSPHTGGSYFHGLRTCNSYWNSVEPMEEGFHGDNNETFDGIEEFLLGMSSQVTEREDNVITEDLRGRVFGPLEFSRRDLMALNIQRGRDHGLPDYNTARVEYGLSRVDNFSDINPTLFAQDPELLANITAFAAENDWTTDKCDIWVCGLLETTERGPGPLFREIVKDQFERIRDGDRFWFENYRQNGLFTEDEVAQLWNLTLYDVISSITNITDMDMQENVFLATDSPCFQPKQLSQFDMEPCTPDRLGDPADFKRQTFDYFSGSEWSYALSFGAMGLFVVGCVLVLVCLAKRRKLEEAKERIEHRRKETTSATRRESGQSTILASEYMGGKDGEHSVQIMLGPGKTVKVLDQCLNTMRTIDLKNYARLDIYLAVERNGNMLAMKIPKEYDLILHFDTMGEHNFCLRELEKFLGQEGLSCNKHEMKGKELMKKVKTKADRQKQLERFFRINFAQAFNEDNPIDDQMSFREAQEVLSCELTKAEFAQCLSMKSDSIFVEQMFNLVDKDSSGYINFREFLDVIVIFAKGTGDDKAKLMFNMYDVDGDGKLTREEFKNMLRSMMDMVNTEVEQDQLNELVDAMMKAGGVSDQEILTLQDFLSILGDQKHALNKAGLHMDLPGNNIKIPDKVVGPRPGLRRESTIIRVGQVHQAYNREAGDSELRRRHTLAAPPSVQRLSFGTKSKVYTANKLTQRLNSFTSKVQNNKLQIFWMTLYLLVTAGIFIERAYFYSVEREHAGLRRITGFGVSVTRGAASGQMWTYSVILLTMCRNTITHMRETFLHRYIPFDSAIAMHKFVAMSALFFTIMHCFGHGINFFHISTQPADDLTCLFRDFYHRSFDLPKFHYWLYETTTGMTGVLLVLLLAVMYVFSTQYARRYVFKAFWFTHNLYPILYILTIVHGSGHLVQEPYFYYFLLGPLVLFTLDKLVSISRKKVEIPVLNAELLPSAVTMLELKRPANFDYKSGQWVRIASAALGNNEYHPFTLTSAPHEDTLSLHIRSVGPWTNNLRKVYDPAKIEGHELPMVFVDGPYGEGHQDWYKFPVAVLIGGGIGVTPFAAILKDIVHKSEMGAKFVCKKIYFLWVTRTQKQFEWLTDIIREVEEKDKNDLVSVHIFITQFYQKFDLRTTMLYICERHFQRISGRSLFTGLRSITHFGRPDFQYFLTSLQEEHPETLFGVFSCGPPPMTADVAKACNEMNKLSFGDVSFIHHSENF